MENPYEIVSIELENLKILLNKLNIDLIPEKLNKGERIYYLSGDIKENVFHIGLLLTNQRLFINKSTVCRRIYDGEDCKFQLAENTVALDVMAVSILSKIENPLSFFKRSKFFITLQLTDHETLRVHPKTNEMVLEFFSSKNAELFLDIWKDTEFTEDALECQYPGLHDDGNPDITEFEPELTYKRHGIPEKVKLYVWKRDEGKCVRCNSRVNLEYDHIIPISKGGSNTERNIELLCEKCNRQKSNKIM